MLNNNQAYLANPGGTYSEGMLKSYMKTADQEDRYNLTTLIRAMSVYPYLKQAYEASQKYLKG